MAGVRVVLNPDLRSILNGIETRMFEETFGPAILADMQDGTPVLTGRLRDSERFEVVEQGDKPALHVGVYPDDDGIIPYKLAVEFGFHGLEQVRGHFNRNFMGSGRTVWIRPHERMGYSPEQPYMRPALWRVRTP
jgi:hypothetical protein